MAKPHYFIDNDAREELAEENGTEVERIGSMYIGIAGEHYIQSELLFHGYNATIMSDWI
jgi:hypothetical protein